MCMSVWNWIANAGSIASLVGLPIAIWQLHSVNKRLRNSAIITNRIREHYKIENLSMILEILEQEYNNVLSMKIGYKKSGTKWSNTQSESRRIIESINKCAIKLSKDYSDQEQKLQNFIGKMTQFISNDEKPDSIDIQEAENILHDCVKELKKTIEEFREKELSLIGQAE